MGLTVYSVVFFCIGLYYTAYLLHSHAKYNLSIKVLGGETSNFAPPRQRKQHVGPIGADPSWKLGDVHNATLEGAFFMHFGVVSKIEVLEGQPDVWGALYPTGINSPSSGVRSRAPDAR